MNILGYILLFTLIGSVISLVGGILLLVNSKIALKSAHFLSAFAAGTLLGTAFFDLLPESFEELDHSGGEVSIFFWTLIGILVFFLLERFIHHHDSPRASVDESRGEAGQLTNPNEKKALVPMIIVGDTLHNFVDGVAIAATFFVSIPLGIVTAFAVAAHEIPQEMADFGLMLSRGVKRGKILWINFLSALAAILGAVLTYVNGELVEQYIPVTLSVTAGFFIYIALANLIPEIHSQDNKRVAFWEAVMLFVGVIVVYFAISLLEGVH